MNSTASMPPATPGHLRTVPQSAFFAPRAAETALNFVTAPAHPATAFVSLVRTVVSTILILLASSLVSVSHAQTTFYWDANGGTAGTGGTGSWSPAAGSLWRDGSDIGTLTAWSNTNPDDYAVFGGTAGTVTVTATTDVARMTFLVSGYTIARSAGTFTLTTDGIIDTGAFNATISAPMAGTVGLTKNGAGTLTLTGTNTYTGATTINAGTITMGASNVFANTSTLTLNGGTLDVNTRSDTLGAVTLNSGSITGTTTGTLTIGALTLGGPGGTTASISTGTSTLRLGGTLTYNAASNPNGATIAGQLSLGTANRTFTIGDSSAASDDLTISAVISQASGSPAIVKNGSGTLVLSGNNTYDGLTTVSAGTLTISGSNTGAAGGVTLTAGTLNLNSVNAVGTGTLSLNGGTLNNTSGSSITIASNNAQSWGGDFAFTGTNDLNLGTGAVTLTANRIATINGGTLTVGGVVGGAFTLEKAGGGTLLLSGSNTYSGLTTVSGGTLRLGATGDGTNTPLGTTAAGTTVTSGAALDLNGFTLGTSEALTLSGTGISSAGALINNSTAVTYNGGITLGAVAPSIGGSGNITVSGAIVDGATTALTKVGANTLTLSGANTYTGLTTVSAGTLRLGSTAALGTNAAGTTVTSGAVLDLNGFAPTTAEALTLSGTGISSAGALINSATAVTYTGGIALGAVAPSIGGSGNITVSGAIVDGATTALTKVGSNTLVLSGANTYTGLTTVSAGTLQLGSTSALGTNAAGTTVTSGAVLDLNGFAPATAEALTLSGTGISSAGALINSATAVTYTGGITLGAVAPSIGGSGNITVSGAVVDGATTALTKVGANTLTLSGANTYTGLTTVSTGTLRLGSTSALGTNAAGTTVTSGAVLDLNGFAPATAEALTLSGTGISSAGALINNSTAVTYTGGITLGAVAPSIGGSGNITVSGAVVDGATTALTKVGANTLTLSGANTYTGGTTVSAGTLAMGSATALGSGNTSVALSATVDSAAFGFDLTKISGAGTLTGTGAYTYNSASNASLSTILAGTGATVTKSGSGTLALSGNNTFTGGTTISAGVIEAQHSNALSSSGNIIISSGAQLSLNAAGAETFPAYVIGNPAAISSFAVGGGTNTVTIAGAGPGGTSAAIINSYATVGGSFAQINNNIVLSGNATVSSGSTSGNTLALGRRGNYNFPAGSTIDENSTISVPVSTTLTFIGSTGTTTRVEGGLSGLGNLNINTDGTVHYYGPQNTLSGNTTVSKGTLIVDTSPNDAAPTDPAYNKFYGISGPLIIGDDTGTIGGSGGALVQVGNSPALTPEAIKSTVPVTIFRDGKLDLNNNAQTIGTLTMTGGMIDSGSTGYLFLDHANTSVVITPDATSGPSIINGRLSLTYHRDSGNPLEATDQQNRTFDVGYNAANSTASPTNGNGDLLINANVSIGSLTKIGNGTMTLATSNNDYDGTTTISAGILNVRVGTNGSSKSSLGLGSTGTTVTTGATSGTLQLQGGIAITTEGLTLAGDGHNGTQGALENLSGNNTWGATLTGQIVLAGNATIGSTAGLLTIPTALSSSGGPYGLTVRGAGNTTISGAINTGTTSAASLTKLDAGTLTLSGTSDFYGATSVQGGIVVLESSGALGNTSGGTSVTSGAELRLTNTIAVGSEALTLNGTGVGASDGALRNYSGSNTYGGAITIGSAATRINSDTGLLSLTGGISTGGNAFVVGGAGNTTETGAVGGSGALTKDGAGTAIFSNIAGLGSITKNDAGTLTFSGSSTTGGTVNMNAGTLNFNGATATVGQVHLLGGASSTINVGASSTLNTDEFDSTSLSTLNIATGGTVVATYDTGNTTFSGQITGGGTFKAFGPGQVTFDQTINNSSLIVYLGGTSVGTNATPLTFSITNNAHLTFKDLYITGDTILDFGNSSASFLTSANLYISANVLITVQNWISLTDAWYATSTFSGGLLDRTGSTPENQITFTGFSNNSTTWATIATYGYLEHEIRPVPEPSTYGAIFLSGALGLIAFRRYRRHAAAKTVSRPKAE